MARAKKPKETVIQDEGPKKFTISYRDYQNQVWTKLINKLWVIEWQRESINSVWPLYRCLESIYIHFEKWTELRTKLGLTGTLIQNNNLNSALLASSDSGTNFLVDLPPSFLSIEQSNLEDVRGQT